jgi:rhomboid protease GluP
VTGSDPGGREGVDYDVKRCAKCAALIPSSATMCAYCNTTAPDAPLARAPGSLLSIRHGYSVTNALIVANLVYFLFSLYVQARVARAGNPVQWATTGTGLNDGLYFAGAYQHAEVVVAHEWWRILCATFLHVGGIHLALNMLALKQLGDLAEGLFGPAKFITVYVVSGICSSLGVSLWYAGVRNLPADEIHGVAGASGAIFGVAGVLITYLNRAGTVRGRAIGMSIGRNVLMMLALGVFISYISQVGHVAGLLPGLLFGLLLRGEFGGRVSKPRTRANWARVAFVAVALVLTSLLAGSWHAHASLGGL